MNYIWHIVNQKIVCTFVTIIEIVKQSLDTRLTHSKAKLIKFLKIIHWKMKYCDVVGQLQFIAAPEGKYLLG